MSPQGIHILIARRCNSITSVIVTISWMTCLSATCEPRTFNLSITGEHTTFTTSHVNKTKFMVFHSVRKNVNYPTLSINGINIERVADFNFLGIQLSEDLQCSKHQNNISLKLTKTVGVLNRVKYEYPLAILKTLYNTLFLPHLNYGILLWGSETESIHKVQKELCVSFQTINSMDTLNLFVEQNDF